MKELGICDRKIPSVKGCIPWNRLSNPPTVIGHMSRILREVSLPTAAYQAYAQVAEPWKKLVQYGVLLTT
jgi:hypothetical protein